MALDPRRGNEPDRFVTALLAATIAGPLVSASLAGLVYVGIVPLLAWLVVFPIWLASVTDRAEPAVAVVGNVLSVSGFVIALKLLAGVPASAADGDRIVEMLLALAGIGTLVAAISGVLILWMKTRRAQ